MSMHSAQTGRTASKVVYWILLPLLPMTFWQERCVVQTSDQSEQPVLRPNLGSRGNGRISMRAHPQTSPALKAPGVPEYRRRRVPGWIWEAHFPEVGHSCLTLRLPIHYALTKTRMLAMLTTRFWGFQALLRGRQGLKVCMETWRCGIQKEAIHLDDRIPPTGRQSRHCCRHCWQGVMSSCKRFRCRSPRRCKTS